MPQRVIQFQMRVVFDDLDDDERDELIEMEGGDATLPTLADYEPAELASIFDQCEEEMFTDFFGGSGVYGKITGTSISRVSEIKE